MALSIDKALRLAQKHLDDGQTSEAEAIFKEILRKFPKNKKTIQGYQKLKLGITSKIVKKTAPSQKQIQEINRLYLEGLMHEVISRTKRMIALYPQSLEMHILSGEANRCLGNNHDAIESYQKVLKIKPRYAEVYNNLGNVLKQNGNLREAIDNYKKAIKIKANYTDACFNLANTLHDYGELEAAISYFKKVIETQPRHAEAYFNMSVALHEMGDLDGAINGYETAIKLQPEYPEACNNLGNSFRDLGDLTEAQVNFKRAILINPEYSTPYWNLSGTETQISVTKSWLKKCLEVDDNYQHAHLMLAALDYYDGDHRNYLEIINSDLCNHPFTRSFSWVFSLPYLPKLYFNKWQFLEAIADKSLKNRPFYEFGVWRGTTFKFLTKIFGEGYGFDTFEGLPEDWHKEKMGTYSSSKKIPKIDGGKFIVGKFDETLPNFFSVSRPRASVINFDADLYTSTKCALTHSKSVIDGKTILIFDEFFMNQNWEEDEFKALEEFCAINLFTYTVLAICFFSKQVAIRLHEQDFFIVFISRDIAARPIIKSYSYQSKGHNILSNWLII
tara:strand:- start:470 stop:2146 length:1677 start_codon:yes stop_codon:yes gene_type:complete